MVLVLCWYGFSMHLVWFWYGFGMVWGSFWYGLGMGFGMVFGMFWYVFCNGFDAKAIQKPYQNIPKPCHTHAQTMPKPCPNHTNTIDDPYKNLPKTMPKSCQNHARNMPKTCQLVEMTISYWFLLFLCAFLLLSGRKTKETDVSLTRTGLRCAAGVSPPSAATPPGVVSMAISKKTWIVVKKKLRVAAFRHQKNSLHGNGHEESESGLGFVCKP